MATLAKKTLVLRTQGNEQGEWWIDKGTPCKIISRYREANGERGIQIEIDSYLYHVEPNDITEDL